MDLEELSRRVIDEAFYGVTPEGFSITTQEEGWLERTFDTHLEYTWHGVRYRAIVDTFSPTQREARRLKHAIIRQKREYRERNITGDFATLERNIIDRYFNGNEPLHFSIHHIRDREFYTEQLEAQWSEAVGGVPRILTAQSIMIDSGRATISDAVHSLTENIYDIRRNRLVRNTGRYYYTGADLAYGDDERTDNSTFGHLPSSAESVVGDWNFRYFFEERDRTVGGKTKANERAEELLLSFLSPQQAAEYEERGIVSVVGSNSGKTYQIKRQRNYGVVMPDGSKACLVVDDSVPIEDQMLGLVLLLETNEEYFLEHANFENDSGIEWTNVERASLGTEALEQLLDRGWVDSRY